MSISKFKLTEKETAVMIGIAKGFSTKEIAANANRSPKTIEKQRGTVYLKLGVRTIAGCVLRAVEMGLVSPDDAR